MNDLTKDSLLTKKITCFHCERETQLFQPNDYVMFVCPNCNKITSKVKTDVYKKLPNKWKAGMSSLRLHAKGILEDKIVTIVGIVIKKSRTDKWTEYHLVDEDGQNHILTEYRGHYHYLKFVPETDKRFEHLRTSLNKTTSHVEINGLEFKRLEYNYASTLVLTGEFSFDAIGTNDVFSAEYVSPPYLFSIEIDENKTKEFFFGHYIKTSQIRKQFPTEQVPFADTSILGMAEPIMGGLEKKKVNFYGMIGLGILAVLFVLFKMFESDAYVLGQDIAQTEDKKEYISQPFVLDEQLTGHYLEFNGASTPSNEWLEAQLTLVNEQTGEEREVALGIEYYSGVDDGYSWSEGSFDTEVYLSGVKPGKYHLKTKIISENPDNHLPFSLTIYDTHPTTWNFGLIILIWGGALIIFNLIFNSKEELR